MIKLKILEELDLPPGYQRHPWQAIEKVECSVRKRAAVPSSTIKTPVLKQAYKAVYTKCHSISMHKDKRARHQRLQEISLSNAINKQNTLKL